VRNDPQAARVVFESGVPLVVGCAEVCLRDLSLTTRECQNLLEGTGPAGAWLAKCFAEFPGRMEREGRQVWPIWDLITPAHLLGFTRTVEHHRPRLAEDLSFDHTHPQGQITWIESVESERLWADFVGNLKVWEERRKRKEDGPSQTNQGLPETTRQEPNMQSTPHRAERSALTRCRR
jgi:hypothetical protein